MSDFSTLDHLRAKAAAKAIYRNGDGIDCELKRALDRGDYKPLKRYRSVICNAPTYVRQVGLLQALAFWMSKDRFAEPLVVQHLIEWLSSDGPEHTKRICEVKPAIEYKTNDRMSFVEPLLERTSTQIAVLEAEAEVYLGWLGRIIEGIHAGLPKKKKDDDGKSEPGQNPEGDAA